jgi:hypothetical protein
MANQTHINLLKMHSKYVEEQEAYKEEAEKKIEKLEKDNKYLNARNFHLIQEKGTWQQYFEDLELYLVSKHGTDEAHKMIDDAHELSKQIWEKREKERHGGFYKIVYVKPNGL